MEKDCKVRIRQFIKAKGMTVQRFEQSIGRANGYFAHVKSPTANIIFDISIVYPDLDLNWLITGQGEMYKKEHNAGRDNNINTGDNNKNYSINDSKNSGIIGDNSGTYNYVSLGDQQAKKIIEPGKVTIEMQQSAEIDSLRQTNAHLEDRIRDLEKLNVSQAKTIETMQFLIDTLNKK
jgi:hypothetical protein